MTATVAAPTGNGSAVWLVIGIVAVFGILAVLVRQERIVIRLGKRDDIHGRKIRTHDKQLATLAGRVQSLADFLKVDVHDARDDSPEAEEQNAAVDASAQVGMEEQPADAKTDEIPVAPATVPDGMPLAVQSALLRPSPVPRGKSAEWVEAEIEAMRARNAERMARAVTEEVS